METYVYLYSSEKYPESVAEMKEEKQEFTRDLNIFCSLRVQARAEGESKYWCAKLRYKTNADAWAEVYTSPVLIDGTIH